MLIALQSEVGPDLVGDDHNVVVPIDLHGLFQLPALPHPAAGVVRRTEHGGMNLILLELSVHIVKVHPPHAVLIQLQGAENDAVAVAFDAVGEADVGGGVDKDFVSGGTQHPQGADQSAQHAVFIADARPSQASDVVARLLPADDGVKIFLRGGKIAESGVLCPLDQGLGDGRNSGEVHVRHPHGDRVKTFLGSAGGGAVAQGVNGDGVLASAVEDTGKIVFHLYLAHVRAKPPFRLTGIKDRQHINKSANLKRS